MKRQIIEVIENFVEDIMHDLTAHDFKHADRVRNLAIYIANKEKYTNLEMVQAAALLHDIGLKFCKNRKFHGEVGAEFAHKYLSDKNYFTDEQIDEIITAIKYHDTKNERKGKLLNIIRDAEIIDSFGAIGIMRAFISNPSLKDYDHKCVKGSTWEASNQYFKNNFAKGLDPGPFMIDEINFQMSRYEDLNTAAAKELGKTYLNFMKLFLVELEFEVESIRLLSEN